MKEGSMKKRYSRESERSGASRPEAPGQLEARGKRRGAIRTGGADEGPRWQVWQGAALADVPQLRDAPDAIRRELRVVAQILPFKVNGYVVDELIDWTRVPDDPIYRMTFPHREMLEEADFRTVAALVDRGAPAAEIRSAADAIRRRLNPHPGRQLEANVPVLDGRRLNGLQHKYPETVLYFPARGQTCHAYCAYCFRWAQFVGMSDLKQEAHDGADLVAYLHRHPEVTDVLITGGDPLVMSTANLARYLEPLLADDLEQVTSIRLGTKALSFWPYRFTAGPDADDLLRLLERVGARGRQVSIMAHVSHPRELSTPPAVAAVRRLRSAGAILRAQSPLVRRVNDDAAAWTALWARQVSLGMIPYYMFVERDTGARRYYEIPLVQAHAIYRAAVSRVSGLARTVRGPVMSAAPGKVLVRGTATLAGETVFCLEFLQARNPDWCGRPFFARFDESATWLDQLRPAFGADRFFFEPESGAAAGSEVGAGGVTRAAYRSVPRDSIGRVR